jgi:Ca2+-binding EF-hand superfamily protein
MSSNLLAAALVLAAAGWQPAAAQVGRTMRFHAMDRNDDGRISRAEWTGSDRSFEVHDWNGDGLLSGDEVRPGARRPDRRDRTRDVATPGGEYPFDDWTVRGFTSVDRDRDNRITADEWHFDRESFRRADHDGDGVITRREFLNEDTAQDDDREDRFADLDVNRDNRVSRGEWHGARANFDMLDDNGDGVLTREEVFGAGAPPNRFTRLDVNRDGAIARDEWHGSRASFNRLDRNRDQRLTPEELSGTRPPAARSRAYQSGYDRGLVEGRAAGREDRERNQGWDLEGQRELEQADSGYDAAMGSRADYQAGYRAAFRIGYREGFGPR